MTKAQAATKREELFKIIEDLVPWENTNNEQVLARARAAIWDSWRETCRLNRGHPQAGELFDPDKLPAFHDPFAGGGALPLGGPATGAGEFRFGLEPSGRDHQQGNDRGAAEILWPGTSRPAASGRQNSLSCMKTGRAREGLQRTSAATVIGCAPKLNFESVISTRQWKSLLRSFRTPATLARIYSPTSARSSLSLLGSGPARFGAQTPSSSNFDVPLASTFSLSSREGKQAYVQPIVDGASYRFTVRLGVADEDIENGTKLARGANFRCVLSGSPIEPKHIYAEARAGRMGARLMAIVAEGTRGRVYLPPTSEHEAAAVQAPPEWRPDVQILITRVGFLRRSMDSRRMAISSPRDSLSC